MRFPFEMDADELPDHLDGLVDIVWDSLQSNFLTLPRGPGFVDYEHFAAAYDELLRSTQRFADFRLDTVWKAFEQDPLVFVVIRTILGMSPTEWAFLTSRAAAMEIPQKWARQFDRSVRRGKRQYRPPTLANVRAMLEAAVEMLSTPVGPLPAQVIHRLDKIDTRDGVASLQYVASSPGVPYPMLLYERFMGRPFASHRDAVSELIGDAMENAIEDVLSSAGVSYRKTKRAERIPGFEQAPDFIIPDELRPHVVIEAKITEDDGTARDKVTRIINLQRLSEERQAQGQRPFQVVACIDGRGFGIRREDMRQLILKTGGKVFTLRTLDKLVDYTDIARFRTKP